MSNSNKNGNTFRNLLQGLDMFNSRRDISQVSRVHIGLTFKPPSEEGGSKEKSYTKRCKRKPVKKSQVNRYAK